MEGYTIVGGGKLILENAKIYAGDNALNNILYIPENHTVKLKNCSVHFLGKNSLIYFCNNIMSINVSIFNDSTLYIDTAFSTNKTTNIVISEHTSVFIGRENLYSFGVWFRTADPHLIYDCKTRKRANISRSIFVGDHVWIGQDCLILKNTFIGSGSIIGAKALCSNKVYKSNASFGGSPARLLKDGVFFTKECVHNYTESETAKSLEYNSDKYIFSPCANKNHLTPQGIMEFLDKTKDINKRIEFLSSLPTDKNRFFLKGKK